MRPIVANITLRFFITYEPHRMSGNSQVILQRDRALVHRLCGTAKLSESWALIDSSDVPCKTQWSLRRASSGEPLSSQSQTVAYCRRVGSQEVRRAFAILQNVVVPGVRRLQ